MPGSSSADPEHDPLLSPLEPSSSVPFTLFNPQEEATRILKLTAIRRSYLKMLLVVPVLSVITGFVFALCLYWYPGMRKKWMYHECKGAHKATHMFVEGTSGHSEIVKVRNRNEEVFRYVKADKERQAYLENPFLVYLFENVHSFFF